MTQNKTLNTQLMKRIFQCSKQVLILILLLIGCFTTSYGQISRPSRVPFEVVPNSTFNNFRGELKMIGNTSIAPTIRRNGASFDPDNAYNFRGVENGSHRAFGYIDIDTDDDTESSSSAYFERFSTCGRIVYAGLYWSATYYDVNQTTRQSNGDLRPNYNSAIQPDPRPDYRMIKFKPPNTPTGQYVDIVADRVLYDGYPGSPFNPNNGPNDTRPGITPDPAWPNINNNAVVDMPYHCYAEVTDIVLTSTNPDGDYFVADQKATVGPIVDLSSGRSSSSNDLAAGWTLVIIYEDNDLPAKFISTNYGLAAIEGGSTSNPAIPVDFSYSGFRAVDDVPFSARYGIGTYEGDQNFERDQLQIESPLGSGNYPPLFTSPENTINNFFDSTITVDGANYLQRNPASENCLGFDTDIFFIQERDRSPIANGQTSVNFRLVTGSDKYQVFVNTFEVEVIAPKVVMTKRVLSADPSAPPTPGVPNGFVDITDDNVNFNEEVFYNLEIQNVGNEDVTEVRIEDIIPANVDFEDFDFESDGITPTYTPPTFNPDGSINTAGVINLEIDDNVIREGDPPLTFRFRVRVVADCASLRDACSDIIANIARSSYTGVISGVEEGDESVVERDDCSFNVVGASSVLVNDDICFNRAETARICRDQVTLSGGNDFTSYRWEYVDDPSANPLPGSDQQDLLVTNAGTTDASGALIGTQTGTGEYILTTTSTDCRGIRRRFQVLPETTPVNPIVNIIAGLGTNPNANGTTEDCSITGNPFPEIFLCGRSASVNLPSGFGATTVWQRLAPGACPTVSRTDNCPTVDPDCDSEWTTFFRGGTLILGGDPDVDVSGEYRILTTVDDDCPTEVYFNVFQSNFDPRIRKVRDRLCDASGALLVTSTFANVQYQLVRIDPTDPTGNGDVAVGGFQDEPLFNNITSPGLYRVDLREIGSPAEACTFPSNRITINDVSPTFEFNILSQPSCATGDVNTTGSIEVIISNGEPTYSYEITGPVGYTPPPPATTSGLTTPRLVFDDLIPGDYTITAYADDDNDSTNCVEVDMPSISRGNDFTITVTTTATLRCNPDFNPTPDPAPSDVTGFDDDEYIAIVEVTITSTPFSANYRFSTNPDFAQTADYLTPFEEDGNVYRFRFTETNLPVSLGTPFTIYVRDRATGAGCVAQGGTTVNEKVEIEAAVTATDPPCFNENGTINVDVTAGESPFTFLIDGTAAIPTTTPGTGDGLGRYTFAVDPVTNPNPAVTIQNGGISCDEVKDPLTFNVPREIILTLGDITQLECTTTPPSGAIEIRDITGGSGTYEYSIDDNSATATFIPAPATPFTIPNIEGEGAHVIYVRNVVATTLPATPNCQVSEDFSFDPLRSVESVTATPTGSDCAAQTTNVTLSAEPALPSGVSYTFTVTPAAPVTAGVYTLNNETPYTIVATRPDSNCTAQTVFTPPNIDIATITDRRQTSAVSCNGGNDGVFQFTVGNGSTTNPVTTFDYTITRPASGTVPALNITVPNNTTNPVTITGSATTPIIAGTYTITITDRSLGAGSTGCTDTKTVVITEPDPITFTPNVDQRTCTNNVVSVVDVEGGNGPIYNYTLFDNGGTAVGPTRPSTEVYENVPNDNGYTITVTDTDGCPQTSAPFDIIQLTSPVIAEGTGTPTDYCLSGDGEVSFTVDVTTLGTGAHSYTLTRDGALFIGSTNINLTPPVSFTTTPPPALTQAGTYQFTVTDEKGCFDTIDFIINEPIELSAPLVDNIRCNTSGDPTDPYQNGEISFSFVNGYVPTPPAIYTIEGFRDGISIGTVASGAGPTFPNFQTIQPGIYTFRITDGRGCESVLTDPVQLSIPVDPTYDDAPALALNCFGDTGTVEINFDAPNLGDFEFAYPGLTTTTVGSTLLQIPNQGAGTYNYTFTNTVTGCVYPGTATVTTPDELVNTNPSPVTDITCSGDPAIGNILGRISLTFDGGTPSANASSYTYSVTRDGVAFGITPTFFPAPDEDRVDFENLDFGFYIITVTDGNMCEYTFGPFEVRDAVDELNFEERTVVASCAAGPTLDIYVTDGSGVNPNTGTLDGFAYQIVGSGNPPAPLDDSAPDEPILYPTPTPGIVNDQRITAPDIEFGNIYIIRIIDLGTNCTYEREVKVVSPAAPSITLVTITPEQCENADDGSIIFEVNNYSPDPVDITWEIFRRGSTPFDPPVRSDTQTLNGGAVDIDSSSPTEGLEPGQYFIRVEEVTGLRLCAAVSGFFTIDPATPKRMEAGTPSTANCNDPNSRVIMTTNGGNPFTAGTTDGYRYLRVDDDPGSPGNPDPAGVPSDPTIIGEFVFTDNTIDLGTVDNITYHIYSVDANGCVSGPIAVVADVAPAPGVSLPPFVDDACTYDNNYTFDATASAQTVLVQPSGTLTFAIDDANDPADTPRVFTSNPATPRTIELTVTSGGRYRVVVTDGNGCTEEAFIDVFDPLEFSASFTTPPICAAADGTIETTLDSGTPEGTLSYELLDNTGTATGNVTGASTGTFTGVAPGSYIVEITDPDRGPGAGCSFRAPVSIEAPIQPDIDTTTGVTNASCNSATPTSGTPPDDGTQNGRIEVSLVGGLDPTATYQYAIVSSTPPGITRPLQSSNIFNNLPARDYLVRVEAVEPNGPGTTDDVLCFIEETYTVGEAPAIVLGTPAVTSFSCNTTDNSEQFPTITIQVSGGTLTAGGSYRVSYTRPAPLTPIVDEVVVDADAAAGIQFRTSATVEGIYNFTFKDSNNCEQSTSATVLPFNRLTNESVEVTAPGITCSASEEVTVSVEGGTTGDTFTFAEITGTGLSQTGITFDNDASSPELETEVVFTLPNPADETRTYRFRITNDNTGCYVEIGHIVEQVDFLEVVAEQLSPETCFDDADGVIRITVSGYRFVDTAGTTILGGDITYTIIDPATGLEVVDGLGGPIAGSSGTLPMSGVETQTFDLPFGAAQGSYIVQIAQVGNPLCSEEDPVIIQGPNELELILPPFIVTTCALDDGAFTASTNGAQGTVDYRIVETGATSTNGTFTGLAPINPTTPAIYTVIARDTFIDGTGATAFCEDSETIEVRPPVDDLNIDNIAPVGVTCNGSTDGSISVTVSGTNRPFRYTITPVVSLTPLVLGTETDRQDSSVFNLLSPGDYIINVYDSAGCSRATSPPVNISEPDPITAMIDNITPTDCRTSSSDVRVVVTAPSFTAPFIVEARDVTLRDGVSTPSNPILPADRDRLVASLATDASGVVTFPGLPEGIYEFFAISGTCNSDRTPAIIIDAPDQVEAELNLDNIVIVCFGEATGSVDLNSIMGGLGSYVYNLDVTPIDGSAPFTLGPQGDPFFNNLAAGDYVYRIESVPGSGCELSLPFQITQPDTPFEAEAVPTNITCNGENDGSITVTASGGYTTNPYRYSLFNSAGERVFEFVSDEADNVIGSHVFEDLAQDLTGYTVIAEDGEGCTVTINPVIIVEPAPILIDIVATTAEVCAGDSDGTATFSITGGTANPDPTQPTYTWSINGIDFMPVTDPTNLFVEDLPAGTNTLYIRDFNGVACETPREFIIDPGVELEAALEERLICPVWSDPLADQVPTIITPQIYEVEFNVSPETESLGVIYRLVRTDGSTGPAEYSGFQRVFEVTPGMYDAIMLFEMCERTVGTIEVPVYIPLDVPVVQMTGNPQDPNEYEILATGGNRLESDPFYTFFVALLEDGGTVNDIQYPLEVEDNRFAIRETGDYLIRVIDASGCEVSVILNLTYINIRIPNYFTPDDPNGTPEERFWYPRQITPNIDDPFFFENMDVKVFDRYGRMLAEFKGDQQGWDGLYQGKQLPSGDYWFTIILNDVDSREFTGHFTLYR